MPCAFLLSLGAFVPAVCYLKIAFTLIFVLSKLGRTDLENRLNLLTNSIVQEAVTGLVEMITSVTLPSVYATIGFCNLLTLSGMERGVVRPTPANTPPYLLKISPTTDDLEVDQIQCII